MNFAAPPPAKNTNTASGLIEAISVSKAWNSTLGNGIHKPRTDLPPALMKPSVKPATASSPAPYFQARDITLRMPRSASTLPIGYEGCQLENEVRKIFGEHSAPVAASRPALGMIMSVLFSLAILTI